MKEVGWSNGNSHNETKPVGLKLSNQLGLCDMSGNVWEWCADLWHKDYNHAPDSGDEPWLQDGEEGIRVVRGGSWFNNINDNCRVANRY
ncbi:MAG: sulfatase modifying factor 1 [Paraglaciecola sp.]